MMDLEKQALTDAFLIFKNIPYIFDEETQWCKNSFISEKVRKEGNALYIQKNHDDGMHVKILQLYSKSIALAPGGSKELALGYGNRSAFLQHIGKYNECIQDIDRALMITDSNALKVKLLCRKAVCLCALGSLDNKSTLEEAKSCIEKMQIDGNKLNLLKLLAETESSLQNAKQKMKEEKETKGLRILTDVVDVFDSVTIQYTKKYGRHLVATRDFQPGEIIFVEKFYAACLNLKKTFINCHHCLNYIWSGIPCDNCNWAMFCSEECRTEALKNYHDIECPIIRYIESVSNPCVTYHHIGIRLMIMGVKEAGSIEQLKANLQAVDESKDKWFTGGNIKDMKNNFNNIYNLESDVFDKALHEYPKMAITVLYALKKYTTFFGECCKNDVLKSLLIDENVLFIGSLLIKLFKIDSLNRCMFSEDCKNFKNLETCLQNMCCMRGISITEVASLLNHSCTPNVYHCFTDDGKIVVFALRPIKKSSQMFNTYCNPFYESEYAVRQHNLQLFNFTCDCKACKEKWPTLYQLPEISKEVQGMNPQTHKLALETFHDVNIDLIAVDNGSKQINKKIIQKLCKSIAIETKLLPQTSKMTCSLLMALKAILIRVYGIKPRLIGQCQNSTKLN